MMSRIIKLPDQPERNQYRIVDMDAVDKVLDELEDALWKAHDERTVWEAYVTARAAINEAVITVTETEVL